MSDAPYKLSNGVEIPLVDDQVYFPLTLENGLKVLVVSDPHAETAAASVCVSVGCFSDPIPGLAHFLEHMLFLGTETYPDENSFGAFLNENGGASNAYTASEQTNYHFQVKASALKDALHRFSTFFTCPLFTASATARELQAVDSEHSKNQQNDGWRLREVDKVVASPAHPYSKFGTGNSTTLRDEPAAVGVDVRAALLEFHAQHYGPSRATIAVIGSEPVDVLSGWVREFFSVWKQGAASLPRQIFDGHPFDGHHNFEVKIVPVKELRSVMLSFVVPPQRELWRCKPASIFSDLIGHEGPGSLLSCLIARGWASELYAGGGDESDRFYKFDIHIDLTEEGFAALDGVVSIVFAYIGMLEAHGPQKWVWDEIADIKASAFRFQSKDDAWDSVVNLSSELEQRPFAHVVSSLKGLLWTWDAAAVAAVLAALSPSNLRLTVVAKALDGAATPRTERWYGVKYGATPIAPARLAAFDAARDAYRAVTASRLAASGGAPVVGGAAILGAPAARVAAAEALATAVAARCVPTVIDADAAAALFPPLTLPERNAFIATNFALAHPDAAARRAAGGELPSPFVGALAGGAVRVRREPAPTLLARDDGSEVWCLSDAYFSLPKTTVYVRLTLPGVCVRGARGAAAQELLTSLVVERLREEGYAARLANLRYGVSPSSTGVTLWVRGFSHRAGALMARLIERLLAVSTFTDAEFALRKDAEVRRFASIAKNQPVNHVRTIAQCTFVASVYDSAAEVLPELVPIDAPALRALVAPLLASAHATVLLCGNSDAAGARETAASVLAALRAGGSAPPTRALLAPFKQRCVALPRPLSMSNGATLAFDVVRREPARNPSEPNAAVQIDVQIGSVQSARENALLSICAHLVNEPFFDDLRTRQALGYVVQAGLGVYAGVFTIKFIVQSTKLPADVRLHARARATR
jgi:insulysin